MTDLSVVLCLINVTKQAPENGRAGQQSFALWKGTKLNS